MTVDEQVIDAGTNLGIRAVQVEPIQWGTNASLWQFGFLRWYRTLIFKWYERRFVKHLRCQWSFSRNDLNLPADRLCEVIDHALERGWTVTIVLFNFTPEALKAVTDQQKQALMERAGDFAPMAGKYALTAGWKARHKGILNFSYEWIDSQLTKLSKFANNPNVEIELENEILLWYKTRPSAFSPFATQIGMAPVEGDIRPELEKRIKDKGFTLYTPRVVHGYTDWNASLGKKDPWYLGYDQNSKLWDANEWGAHPNTPNLVRGLYQTAFDLARRLPRRMDYHTYGWCFGPTLESVNSAKIYDQFKSPDLAKSWGTPNDYQAVAVCNEDADKALTKLGEVFTFGGAA